MRLDPDSVKKEARRLPASRRWFVQGTPLDYDFSAGRARPQPLDAAAFDFRLQPKWLDLLIFGEYDYAEGGGANPFLGVRRTDGAVYGLDFERDKAPMFLLNSSLEAFVETFELLDGCLAKKHPLPSGVESLLRKIDPKAFAKSDWKAFVRFVLEERDE